MFIERVIDGYPGYVSAKTGVLLRILQTAGVWYVAVGSATTAQGFATQAEAEAAMNKLASELGIYSL